MTRAPFVMGKADEAFSRAAEIYDTTIGWRFVNPLMKAQYGVDAMPETGENVAEEFQVARSDQDAFALRSQQRAGKAAASGYFAEEIVPVEAPGGKAGPVVVDKDEHPRPDTTLERLAKLQADRHAIPAPSPPAMRRASMTAQPRYPRVGRGGKGARADAARPRARHGFGRRCRRASWASARCRPRAN